MPEHLIRLRGPWEWLDPAGSEPTCRRIHLPANPLPCSDRPVRLRRRFGRPARLPAGATCRLRVENAPGLIQLVLNETERFIIPAGEAKERDRVEVPIGDLMLPRNLLELIVAPGPPRLGAPNRPWGAVSLAFGDEHPLIG